MVIMPKLFLNKGKYFHKRITSTKVWKFCKELPSESDPSILVALIVFDFRRPDRPATAEPDVPSPDSAFCEM